MSDIVPVMSEREQDAFCSFVSCATSYFEFGMGGSTIRAGQLVKGRVVAVDSDAGWVSKVEQQQTSSEYPRSYLHVDIGPTKEWGYPTDPTNPEKFRLYYRSIVNNSPKEFDFCFIDGRFRVACFLNTIKYVRAETVIAIHDYRSRSFYHTAEQFGRIIAEVEDITFFVRRPNIDLVSLEGALGTFAVIAS